MGRLVVEAGRQCPAGRKPGNRDAVDRGFGAACHHDIGVAQGDQAAGVADRVRAGRAGGDHRMIGALEAEFDGDIAARDIDQPARNEERRHPARAAFLQRHRRLGDPLDAADAGADQHAGGDLVLVRFRHPGGVLERLARRAHGVDDEMVDLALLLRLHPLVGVERAVGPVAARDRASDPRRQVGDVEGLDPLGAALSRHQPLPGRLNSAGQWRHHAEAGHDDAPQLSRPGHLASILIGPVQGLSNPYPQVQEIARKGPRPVR